LQTRESRRIARRPALTRTILAMLLAGSAGAQAQTWTGSGLTNNWNDPFNWVGFVPPVSGPATSITFAGIARLTPVQNIASPFQLNALTFASGAGAFVLSGSPLRFAGATSNLIQNSNSAITINNAVQIDGNLVYSGAGSATLAGTLSRSGVNTAANTFLTKSGGGTLTLSGANSFDGVVAINQGQIRLGQALALQNGTVPSG
jgi:autotransporter-associated beta strand protein